LGVASGGRAIVRNGQSSVTVMVISDPGVPRGVASMIVNQADGRVSDLINLDDTIVQVQVESA